MRDSILLTLLFIGLSFHGFAQEGWIPTAENPVPSKPNRLVNDWGDMLSSSEEEALERKLVEESDSTSTQIAILTIQQLNGYDIAQLSFKIGDAWGIGGPSQDNGLLILASKNDREIWIATGKGMEGPVPDVTAKRIIENIIVPSFRDGDYYQGFDEATTAIIKLTRGEFVDELGDREDNSEMVIWIFIIIMIILFWIISRRRRGGGFINRGGWHPTPWIWGGGGFGGGGGGGFGGGGGGFGGFGGGSFGGGGAGGRW